MQIGDTSAIESIDIEQDWPIDSVVSQGNEIPPDLPLAVNCAASINVNVSTAEDKEARRVLECKFE